MARLIDHLLTLSRAARKNLLLEPTDLSAMARSVLDELQDAQPERRVGRQARRPCVGRGRGRQGSQLLLHAATGAGRLAAHARSLTASAAAEREPAGPLRPLATAALMRSPMAG
jgi:light-regulated signal transduction histidine kinase (bacteriophytochrome)